jgi:TIGR03009 family protein
MSKSLWIPCLSILPLAAAIAPAIGQDPGIRLRAPQQNQAQQQPVRQQQVTAQQPPRQPQQVEPEGLRLAKSLSPQEQQRVFKLLEAWEQESNKVQSFKCKFTRWDYDKTFGPLKNDFLMSERQGEIKFRAPDKGSIKETSMKVYEPPQDPQNPKDRGKYVDSKDGMEHWVCDGSAIYQFKAKVKTLEVTDLPPHMRGKAITEGPLPFVFGAKAKTLKERYWFREVPNESKGSQIWLEAWPKFAEQAANFQKVQVILGAKDLLPVGMEIYAPNGNDRSAYMFEEHVVNDPLGFFKGDFMPPMTPFGWKKVNNADVAPPAAQAPPANPLKQAIAPKNNTLR